MISGKEKWSYDQVSKLEKVNVSGQELSLYKSDDNSLYELFKSSVVKNADNTALINESGTSYTYQEVSDMTDEFAKYLLLEKYIQKQEKIAVMLFNSIEFIITALALSKIEAVMVLLPTKNKKSEIDSLSTKIEFKLAIIDLKFESSFKFLNPSNVLVPDSNTKNGLFKYKSDKDNTDYRKTSKESEAIIMFTSGTTSDSKGCVIKNYNIVHAILGYKNVLRITSEDVTVIGTPMYHITGLVAILGLFFTVGATVIYHKKFEAKKILNTVKEHNITFIHASPTVFMLMLEEKDNFEELKSLKKFVCGSSHMPIKKIKEIKEWLPDLDFYPVYGLTETTSPMTIFPSSAAESEYLGSSGIPIPGNEMMIINDDGEDIGENEAGEILVRGATIIDSYYKRDNGEIDKKGWLRTGDIGLVNSEGYLFVVDRVKDMINNGGEKVWTLDVESAIYELDGVDEVVVVPVSDEMYGEVVGAMVRRKPGSDLTAKKMIENLKTNLASYKLPRIIEFVSVIPKNHNSKVNKNLIRKTLENIKKTLNEGAIKT